MLFSSGPREIRRVGVQPISSQRVVSPSTRTQVHKRVCLCPSGQLGPVCAFVHLCVCVRVARVHKCVCQGCVAGGGVGCVGGSLGFPAGVLFSVCLPLCLYAGTLVYLFAFVPR